MRFVICLALAACWSALAACWSARAAVLADAEATRYWQEAWSAALAITNDAADRSRLQQELISAGREAGIALSLLEARAREIDGWRRWAALAEVGSLYAIEGDLHNAKRLGLEAFYKAPLFTEDDHDRILLQAAWTLAAAGEVELLKDLAARYQQGLRMKEQVEGALALALARAGNQEHAQRALSELTSQRPDEGALLRGRVLGRIALFASDGEAAAAYTSAWTQSAELPGYMRIDVRLRLLESAHSRVSQQTERSWIEELTRDLEQTPAPAYVRAMQRAALACALARANEPEKARAEAEAARALTSTIELFERPAIWGQAALALHQAGFRDDAQAWFQEALEAARELVNLRPRNIALARVYLAMAKAARDQQR